MLYILNSEESNKWNNLKRKFSTSNWGGKNKLSKISTEKGTDVWERTWHDISDRKCP